MKYYLYVNLVNNKIIGSGNAPLESDLRLCIEVEEDVYNTYIEHPLAYICKDRQIIPNPNRKSDEERAEENMINHLKMTALDFITSLREIGISLVSINAFIEGNLEIKTQLTYCQAVYCGVVKQFLPITIDDVTVTKELVEDLFRIKGTLEV